MINGLQRAEQRMALYMDHAGARAIISRKSGDSWTMVRSDVPIIVEAPGGIGQANPIDPRAAGEHDAVVRKITVSKATDIARGDRITIHAPRGTGVIPGQVMTVSSIDLDSMAPCTTGLASIEEVAVERYNITIERWNDEEEAYGEVLITEAAVIASDPSAETRTNGASGQVVTGTIIFEPVPEVHIQPGDSIYGIPWARGAWVERVYPVVGNRVEAAFRHTVGSI